MTRVELGISTCPNDTFAFHGLLTGRVDTRGLDLAIQLADVEELNRALAAGRYDVAKASFHAALGMSRELVVLPAGSALGFGVGPLLLGARAGHRPDVAAPARVLCPGEHTTAALLYQLFHPGCGRIEHVVFSEILPALARAEADFGVCIHEGRFTYAEHGLHLVEDLGTRWEEHTGAPLPLGGIVARRQLGADVLAAVAAVVSDSLAYGLAHRSETLPTLRRHAQELADDVLWRHVDLYVNEWTSELGDTGRRALAALADEARRVGLVEPDAPALEVLRG